MYTSFHTMAVLGKEISFPEESLMHVLEYYIFLPIVLVLSLIDCDVKM